MNCDGTWDWARKSEGFGSIARHGDKVVHGLNAGFVKDVNSCIEAEGLVVLRAMEWAEKEGWEKCWCFCQCYPLVIGSL